MEERNSQPEVDFLKEAVTGPWLQGTIIKFLDQYKLYNEDKIDIIHGESESKDNDGLCFSLPLMAVNPDIKKVSNNLNVIFSTFTRDQNTFKTFQLFYIMLSAFVRGDENPLEDIFKKAGNFYPELHNKLGDIKDTKENKDPHSTIIKPFGIACSNPGAFLCAYRAMIVTDSYIDAVRLNMKGGGDCCSRANVVGACYGAKYGLDFNGNNPKGIPLEWIHKTKNIEEILEMTLNIV